MVLAVVDDEQQLATLHPLTRSLFTAKPLQSLSLGIIVITRRWWCHGEKGKSPLEWKRISSLASRKKRKQSINTNSPFSLEAFFAFPIFFRSRFRSVQRIVILLLIFSLWLLFHFFYEGANKPSHHLLDHIINISFSFVCACVRTHK